MQRSFGLQISDLDAIPSVFEQELTLEEAEKIVGGRSRDGAVEIRTKVEGLIGGVPIDPARPCIMSA